MVYGTAVTAPGYFAIGSGSGTALVTQNALLNEEDRQLITSKSQPSIYKVKYVGDWNVLEMSGLRLNEWGVANSATSLGSVWSRTNIPAISFDGTVELRIEEVWEIF